MIFFLLFLLEFCSVMDGVFSVSVRQFSSIMDGVFSVSVR